MSNIANEPMVEIYIMETGQILDSMEHIIMDLEKNEDLEKSINEIFRHMHTIKGNSMMMMFDEVAELAHIIEDLFDYLRKTEGAKPNFNRLTDLVLGAVDFMKAELEKLTNQGFMDGKSEALRTEIINYLESIKFMNPDAPAAEIEKPEPRFGEQKYYIAPSKPDMPVSSGDVEGELHFYRVKIVFEQGCEMENVRAFSIVHNLKDIAVEVEHRPRNLIEDDSALQKIKENGFNILMVAEHDFAFVRHYFDTIAFVEQPEVMEIDTETYMNLASSTEDVFEDIPVQTEGTQETVEPSAHEVPSGSEAPVVVEAATVAEAAPAAEVTGSQAAEAPVVAAAVPETKTAPVKPKPSTGDKTGQGDKGAGGYISVSINKVDKLMDLIGELVVSESMVTKNPDLNGLNLENFNKASRQLRIVVNELQDLVMSVRMVPLTLTFQKMARIVRDMGKKLSKEVDLQLIGENTEVDKNVIERIGDPLMHIIRNSIDHGIEDAATRRENGKDAKGRVVMEARHSGGDVWITIKDDGKGLDRNKILSKANERGILYKPAEDYTDREAYQLIFNPGFSTKDQITEFSGRGVGLDVVTQNIEALGGSILVDSTMGRGSEFSLKIPLTLAIVDGMMMKVGETIFTVPIISIQDSFSVKQKDVIADPDGNEMVMVRGECLPVLRLHRRFDLATETKELHKGILTMVEYDNRSVLLFADGILGEQQVVVKPLSKFMKKIKGISGCALLGDGRITLILDPSGIVSI